MQLLYKVQKYTFLFEELVKRDFKKKYKRTILGMAWSILSPLLTLLVMRLVFTQFFGRNTPHYTTLHTGIRTSSVICTRAFWTRRSLCPRRNRYGTT